MDITWDSLLVAHSCTWPVVVAPATSMAPADTAVPMVVIPPEILVHLDTIEMAVDADAGVGAAADAYADANDIMGAIPDCFTNDNADANVVVSSNMDTVVHAINNEVAAADPNSIAALNSNAGANTCVEGDLVALAIATAGTGAEAATRLVTAAAETMPIAATT